MARWGAFGVWSGVGAVAVWVGCWETPDFWGFKETWGVVLLLLGTLGGIFEGFGTAKCHFGVWMSLRNSEGIFLVSETSVFCVSRNLGGLLGVSETPFFAHCETWGVFLALAETPIAF